MGWCVPAVVLRRRSGGGGLREAGGERLAAFKG
jgi:hypothetical protein